MIIYQNNPQLNIMAKYKMINVEGREISLLSDDAKENKGLFRNQQNSIKNYFEPR